ncbi:3'-5' exonuclease family protein [Sphingomonas nostoxanthinifaciens]|uniref:transcriptional regulator n=1 Tax=Sphingomonas nostoxanthinifaciens TaxID=2872652 RepID=UPI001CC21005|nr:transcriptional regulator [Sphingomonas nostoxanthinifaciens]UAK25251.1 transcriptional regulator [Sphingomonas nostoxanthinifaciens]
MRVFIDFEASSLSKASYPIEVGWVFEDGRNETHLIRPAGTWTDWSPEAEAIHGIARHVLIDTGEPHDAVAARAVEALTGHDLLASAPSWDGKWMSVLLRASGLPRHALRLQEAKAALRAEVSRLLPRDTPQAERVAQVQAILDDTASQSAPVHRALADAHAERGRWQAATAAARRLAER